MLTKRLPTNIFTTVRAAVARHAIEPQLTLPSTIVREMPAVDVGEDDLGFFIWATYRAEAAQKTKEIEMVSSDIAWKTISIPASMHSTLKEARMRKETLQIIYQNSAHVAEINSLQII